MNKYTKYLIERYIYDFKEIIDYEFEVLKE